MSREDLILIHAPSVYDFRRESIFFGPVSDLVPSTPVFEMYPFGFTTMATQLHQDGFRVRIVNLASLMLNNRNLDVEALLKRLDSSVFGLDLHWLPHAQGSLEIARLLKSMHPDSKILMGGLSASYFHEELVTYPQVDLVLRGDSTEVPLSSLMGALETGDDLGRIPNLTWKDRGTRKANPLSFVPENLDYLDIDYGWMIRSVIRHRDLEGFKPFKDWDRYPLTAVFSVRGCGMNCVVCGGSCSALRGFLSRERPAFRSPERLAEDIRNIQSYLDAPTFVVGDLRQGGKDYASKFFAEAKRLRIRNHVVLEIFTPAEEEFYKSASGSLERFSIQFSPDSHEESVRGALGRAFDTESMERTVRHALGNGCERFDMFFMIGLPKQTRESALASADYTRSLLSKVGNDSRLAVFMSPLAPFIDPGSRVFENPGEFGYRLFARTLEEHRVRLLNPSWKYVLSYDTAWMTRDEIADVSYDAADRLNEIKFETGQIDEADFSSRRDRTEMARAIMKEIDEIVMMPEIEERRKALAGLKANADLLMESTICEKRDLEWDTPRVYRSVPRAMASLIRKKR
ncbi:MAG: TIGR04190 family B12-binding domain/radical SAM domain protein [Methanomassiliicoccales archaeon]|nr:TIGR04190 family B12-binding domain/radical SAM domain protein [Methanomassiliicoccales archaeon]